MLKATVDQAASQFDVTPKTIREWIRDGMPVHQRGDKGSGNGAVVDMARAPHWVAEKRGHRPWPLAEYLTRIIQTTRTRFALWWRRSSMRQ